MANKKNRNNNKKLRRELEVLKAQLKVKTENKPKIKTQINITKSQGYAPQLIVDDKAIKKDILKTLALSTIAFTVIVSLWFIK